VTRPESLGRISWRSDHGLLDLHPDQAPRKAVLAGQGALSKHGVAVLVLPVDVSKTKAPDPTFAVHRTTPT
jgi:thiamine pyrophosphate-dependent acetolactate synthase large subunit-like protein